MNGMPWALKSAETCAVMLTLATLVACAAQPRPQPPPATLARTAEAPVKAPMATQSGASTEISRERATVEPPDVIEAPGFESSTPDPVRCPNPYDPEGWPTKEIGTEQARSMNERFGLLCSERALQRETRAGCTDKRGRILIPFIYLELSPFAESGLALALHPDVGWVYIDRHHRRIGEAMTVDATPDEAFGGYARFKAPNGKVGFLDRERRIVIPARYDAAFPFRNCTAVVCVGCHPLRWSKDAPEAAACTGDAFLIDESGNTLESSSGPDWERCEEKQKVPQGATR